MPETTSPASTPALPKTAPTGEFNSETGQATPGAEGEAPPPGGLFGSPWVLVGLAVLWIFILRAGRKNKRAQQERHEELKQINKGDKVVTIGRIHGEVVKTTDKTFTIKPDNKKDYTLTFDREAMLRVEQKHGQKAEKVEAEPELDPEKPIPAVD